MGNHLNINMKFSALLLAVVGVMSSVEANETFESSELMSKKNCKAVRARFQKTWKRIDGNDDKKVTWKEMNAEVTRKVVAHRKNGSKVTKAMVAKYRVALRKHFK